MGGVFTKSYNRGQWFRKEQTSDFTNCRLFLPVSDVNEAKNKKQCRDTEGVTSPLNQRLENVEHDVAQQAKSQR